MADGQSWFGRGFVPGTYTPPPANQQQVDLYEPKRRFRVRVGEKRSTVFVDGLEDGMRYIEHYGITDLTNYDPAKNMFGDKIAFPCLKGLGKPCWLCDSKCPLTRAIALTVIDCDGYVSKKGEVYKNLKKFFIIYEREIPFFKDKSASISGLKASIWKVGRYQKMGTTLGDDYSILMSDDKDANGAITMPWVSKGWVANGRVTKAWAEMIKVEAPKLELKPIEYENDIPFKMTAEDQQRLFSSNPNWSWDKAKKDALGGGASAGAPAGAAAAPAGVTAPPGGGSTAAETPEDDIPF
jgi:hypothetical protein